MSSRRAHALQQHCIITTTAATALNLAYISGGWMGGSYWAKLFVSNGGEGIGEQLAEEIGGRRRTGWRLTRRGQLEVSFLRFVHTCRFLVSPRCLSPRRAHTHTQALQGRSGPFLTHHSLVGPTLPCSLARPNASFILGRGNSWIRHSILADTVEGGCCCKCRVCRPPMNVVGIKFSKDRMALKAIGRAVLAEMMGNLACSSGMTLLPRLCVGLDQNNARYATVDWVHANAYFLNITHSNDAQWRC